MPNGQKGDHPISDVVAHGLRVYGEPTDSELRKIVGLLGYTETYKWFNELFRLSDEELRREISWKLAMGEGAAQRKNRQ
jgi:hypothetical protein